MAERYLGRAQVTLGLVQPPGGRIAVDHFSTVSPGSVGPTTRTTEQHIRIDSQGGERRRKYGKGQSMLAAEERDPVDRCCPDIKTGELWKCPGGMVEGRVDASVRERLGQEQDDSLCAAPLSEIVVGDGDRG